MELNVAVFGCCVSRDAFRFQSCANNYKVVCDIQHNSMVSYDSAKFPIEAENIRFPENITVPNFDKKMLHLELTKGSLDKLLSCDKIDLLVVDMGIERCSHAKVLYDGVVYDFVKNRRFEQWFSTLNNEYNGKKIEITGTYTVLDIPQQQLIDKYKDFFQKVYARFPEIKIICVEALLATYTINNENNIVPFGKGYNVVQSNKQIRYAYSALKAAFADKSLAYIPIPRDSIADWHHLWGSLPMHFTDDYYYYLMECIDNIMGLRFTNTVGRLCRQQGNRNTAFVNSFKISELSAQLESLQQIVKQQEQAIEDIYNSRSYKLGRALTAVPRKLKQLSGKKRDKKNEN